MTKRIPRITPLSVLSVWPYFWNMPEHWLSSSVWLAISSRSLSSVAKHFVLVRVQCISSLWVWATCSYWSVTPWRICFFMATMFNYSRALLCANQRFSSSMPRPMSPIIYSLWQPSTGVCWYPMLHRATGSADSRWPNPWSLSLCSCSVRSTATFCSVSTSMRPVPVSRSRRSIFIFMFSITIRTSILSRLFSFHLFWFFSAIHLSFSNSLGNVLHWLEVLLFDGRAVVVERKIGN